MSKVILVVVCERKLLLVRANPAEKWDTPSSYFDSEPNNLQIEMALANYFKEISIKPGVRKLEENVEFPHYMCFVTGKPRAHENGKTWFASRHNFLPTVLSEQANETVNIPAVLSRL
jgi:hypothetical protein